MKRLFGIVLLAFTISIVGSPVVFAKDWNQTVMLNIKKISPKKDLSKVDYDSDAEISARYSYKIADNFLLDLEVFKESFNYNKEASENSQGYEEDLDMTGLVAGVSVFKSINNFEPYIGAGLVLANTKIEGSCEGCEKFSDSDFGTGGSVYGGLRYMLNKSIYIHTGASYKVIQNRLTTKNTVTDAISSDEYKFGTLSMDIGLGVKF